MDHIDNDDDNHDSEASVVTSDLENPSAGSQNVDPKNFAPGSFDANDNHNKTTIDRQAGDFPRSHDSPYFNFPTHDSAANQNVPTGCGDSTIASVRGTTGSTVVQRSRNENSDSVDIARKSAFDTCDNHRATNDENFPTTSAELVQSKYAAIYSTDSDDQRTCTKATTRNFYPATSNPRTAAACLCSNNASTNAENFPSNVQTDAKLNPANCTADTKNLRTSSAVAAICSLHATTTGNFYAATTTAASLCSDKSATNAENIPTHHKANSNPDHSTVATHDPSANPTTAGKQTPA